MNATVKPAAQEHDWLAHFQEERELFLKRLEDGDARMSKIEDRMSSFEADLSENTEATKTIARNTAGLAEIASDIAAGARLLCRFAIGVRFVIEHIIEPLWKPVLIGGLAIYFVIHRDLPDWAKAFIKVFAG